MFIGFMVTRLRRVFFVPALLLGSGLLAAACQRVPLLAPSGSTITLVASTTALPVNGTTQIIAQVIEASGTPPQEGTQVTFTTSLGTIQPSSAETDSGGRVTVTFNAGTSNGTATISAISGGASVAAANAVKIAVGTAAVGRVNLAASPTLVPATGGTSLITATVFDVNGNGLAGSPVSFTTTAGTLSSVFATADGNGVATTTLQTATKATVTASVGAQAPSSGGTPGGTGTTPTTSGTATATVVVDIIGAPTLVITPPTTAPSAGVPAVYTFVVTPATTNGSPIRDLTVNWGDGNTQDLGAVNGTSAVTHTYPAPGTYSIKGTILDASGVPVTVSSAVTINPKPQPAVSLTAPTTTPTAGTDAAFTGSVAAPTGTGAVIQDVTIDYGDNTGRIDLGAVVGTSISLHHVYQTGGVDYTVTLMAMDSNGGVGTAVTQVFVQIATPLSVLLSASATFNGSTTTESFTATVIGLGNAVVANYLWDFGDGQTTSTSSNTTTHTYNHSTPSVAYLVRVTITTSTGSTATNTTTVVP
jgi:Bacterial Ig-like domain (group 1)/PKD domain